MDDKNEIGMEIIESVTVLDIRGDVTVASEPFLKVAYEKAAKQGAVKIVLKFPENVYINSGGIATLLKLFSQIKRNNQQIAITGLSEHFKKIFSMVGITKFAKVYSTVDEAREGLSK
jgi:anti-anti-sigma factor